MAEYAKRIGEVADILGVSLQTVRNWLKLGDEFYTYHATKTHGKRFSSADIEQLQRIQDHLNDGYRLEQIQSMLPAAPAVVEVLEDAPPQQHQEPTNSIQTVDLFEQVQQLLKQQDDKHQQEIERLEERYRETIDILKSDLERARRPWWKRW